MDIKHEKKKIIKVITGKLILERILKILLNFQESL